MGGRNASSGAGGGSSASGRNNVTTGGSVSADLDYIQGTSASRGTLMAVSDLQSRSISKSDDERKVIDDVIAVQDTLEGLKSNEELLVIRPDSRGANQVKSYGLTPSGMIYIRNDSKGETIGQYDMESAVEKLYSELSKPNTKIRARKTGYR